MVGRLALLLAAACVLAGTAAAAADRLTDPKKRHNAADQAWAAAIRVHRSDLGSGDWRVETSNELGGAPRACKDPDLSDLVETGNSENPDFSRNGSFVGSAARIFLTEEQATAGWRRVAAQPVKRCLVDAFTEALAGSGARVHIDSTDSISLATATPHAVSARIRLTLSVGRQKIHGRFSYYFLARGRATAMLVVFSFGKPLTPISESLERKLATLVSARMKY
jgi:hypothetical protein